MAVLGSISHRFHTQRNAMKRFGEVAKSICDEITGSFDLSLGLHIRSMPS